MSILAHIPRGKIKLLLICLMGCAPMCGRAQIDKEKDAIKTVITKETSSFMNIDWKSWSSSWVQAPYAYWSYSDSTGSSFLEGWETINKTFETYFNSQKPSKATITNDWVEVRVYGNGAYAHFIQKSVDELDTEETSQIRVLEKKNGKWRVVCVSVVAKYPKK